MSYLLDTCVLAELRRPRPEPRLIEWIEATEEERLFLSVLTLGEIQKGISKLDPGGRQRELQTWLEQDLTRRFAGRILAIDARVSLRWGQFQGQLLRAGRPLPVIDALLAATALTHALVLVTRNTSDFDPLAVPVLNPWTGE